VFTNFGGTINLSIVNMKKIQVLIIFIVSMYSINAQNLLKEGVRGFEGEDSGWWIQHKNVFNFSSKKVKNGDYSLKYFKAANSKIKGNMQVHCKQAFTEAIRPGKYKLTAKILLNTESPAGFDFNFTGKNWQSIHVNLKGLKKRKWIEVSKEITLKKRASGDLILAVAENKKFGGYGLFYIDDLIFEKVKK